MLRDVVVRRRKGHAPAIRAGCHADHEKTSHTPKREIYMPP